MSITAGEAVLAVWVALGGGMGAALRFAVDVAVTSRWRGRFPLAIFLVNVSGALALGVVLGLAGGGLVGGGLVGGGSDGEASLPVALLGVGVLGGYTTFSTASYDTVRLLREGRVGMSLAYAVGTMLASAVAAAVGLWLTGAWSTVG